MRLNKSFQDATIKIFKNIFSPEQIEKMIQIDLSEDENILNLPIDKYFERQFNIGDTINVRGNETGNNNQDEIILATYTLMNIPTQTNPQSDSSPAIITFYKDNIKLYVLSLIDSLNCSSPIGLNVALYIHYFVMSDLLCHEGFHHYADVKRELTGSKFQIKIEERLAVAHSYNQLSTPFVRRLLNFEYVYVYDKFLNLSYRKHLFRKMRNQNKQLYDFLLSEHFQSYYSFNYKNWQWSTNKNAYKTDFYNYFKSSKLDELLAFGVPVNKISEEIALIGIDGVQLEVE